MADFIVRRITAAETRPLRHAILRPHQPVEALCYHGDDSATTTHFGAFAGGELLGVTSVYFEAMLGRDKPAAWRLRGMAVTESARRQGCGSALLRASLEHVAAHGGKILWFNARAAAVPFYHAHGFQIVGEEFDLPEAGPHYLMWREVRPADQGD